MGTNVLLFSVEPVIFEPEFQPSWTHVSRLLLLHFLLLVLHLLLLLLRLLLLLLLVLRLLLLLLFSRNSAAAYKIVQFLVRLTLVLYTAIETQCTPGVLGKEIQQ